jgi:alpha-glucoside transport system substrate-binding protein
MNKTYKILGALMLFTMIVTACAPSATPVTTVAPTSPVTVPTNTTAPVVVPTNTTAPTSPPEATATTVPTEAAATATAVPPTAAPTAEGAIDCMGVAAGTEITIINQWTGNEGALFNNIMAPFVAACGVKLSINPTRDAAVLDAAVKSVPPDVLFWPATSPLQLYLDKLVPLTDVGVNPSDYNSSWVSLGTVNGNLYMLPAKSDIKTIVWYSPVQFEADGYTVPTTYQELLTLVDKMVADGNIPWATGFGSGSATGWTGMDFIEDLLLTLQGPDYVSGIIAGTVPYSDTGVIDAWTQYVTWASNPKYAVGGATGTVNTTFSDALLQPFNEPPEAMMVRQSGFASGNILAEYPNYKYGTDFDFFGFPGAQGMQIGADYMFAFSNSTAVKAMLTYITGPVGAANWARAGFDEDPNKNADGQYIDPIIAKKAEILSSAKGVVPSIGDVMPAPWGTDSWTAIIAAVQDPTSIQTQVDNLAQVQMQVLAK